MRGHDEGSSNAFARNRRRAPYGRGLFGLQLPEAHFGVDDAVTTELLLPGGTGGGFGLGVLAVWG